MPSSSLANLLSSENSRRAAGMALDLKSSKNERTVSGDFAILSSST